MDEPVETGNPRKAVAQIQGPEVGRPLVGRTGNARTAELLGEIKVSAFPPVVLPGNAAEVLPEVSRFPFARDAVVHGPVLRHRPSAVVTECLDSFLNGPRATTCRAAVEDPVAFRSGFAGTGGLWGHALATPPRP